MTDTDDFQFEKTGTAVAVKPAEEIIVAPEQAVPPKQRMFANIPDRKSVV